MTDYAAWYKVTRRSILLLAALMVWLCPCAAGDPEDQDEILNLQDFLEMSKTWIVTLPWGPDGLPPQLLAHWRLDMNAQDSQSSFDGEVHGNPVWLTGSEAKIGPGAIYMDGADYIEIEARDFPILTGSFTVDVWLKAGFGSQTQIIISKSQSSWQIGIEGGSQKAFFSCNGLSPISYLVGSTALMDNQWHHLAAVYDHTAQQISLYVDETLDARQNTSGIVEWNKYKIWIGNDPQQPQLGYWWKGTLDNIRIFNYALSVDEIFHRKTWHVDTSTGSDNNDGQARQSAFKTIQYAIETAVSGDLILVWPGMYIESINFLGKAIILKSASEPAVIRSPGDYAFSFYSGEQAGSWVENFIIKDSMVGVSIFCASPTLNQLTFVNNEYAVDVLGYSFPTIQNCIFWLNTYSDIYTEAFPANVSYCCIQRGVSGEGNISQDPLFADPDNGDYHVQSLYGRCLPGAEANAWVKDDNHSPCIDAGSATQNPMNESMPNGGRINMGAYGSTPFASKSPWPLKADMNLNGQVWIEDLQWFIKHWLSEEDD